MGVHQHLYLGPYVHCTYRNETAEVDVVGCTNDKCAEYVKRSRWPQSAKFCATCASPIGPSKKVEATRPSTYDVLGGEGLIPLGHDDKDVWLGSNYGVRGGAPRNFSYEQEEVRIDLESSLNSTAEKKWFEDRFASEILKLKGAYDNVKILWGLHVYFE